MPPLSSRRRFRIARRTVGSWALRALGPRTLRRLARTWRTTELGDPPSEGGALICLWHGRMICGLERYGGRGWSVLVSPSDDGDLSEHLLRSAGYQVVRGSTSRGGARALRELLELLARANKVILTPDGPRGPRHAVNEGVAWMARATGFPVHPMGVACDRAWRFSSWDAFTLPKPRARLAFVWGPALLVPRDADDSAVAAATATLRARLLAAERAGHEHLAVEPDW